MDGSEGGSKLKNAFNRTAMSSIEITMENIATGETSQAITPFHYFNFYH